MPRDWHAVIATILAIGAVIALIILSVSELQHANHVSEAEATIFSTALGAILGAVAVYLGGDKKGDGSG